MWNYGLVESKEDNTVVLAEVYYNDDGTPYGFCDAKIIGDDKDDASKVYEMMKESFGKDILIEDKDFHPMDDDEIASEDFSQLED